MAGVSTIRVFALGSIAAGVRTYVASGTSQPYSYSDLSKPSLYLRSDGGTISAGAVTVEEADWDPSAEMPFTGTWSTITTITVTGLSATAQEQAYHFPAPDMNYGFIRVRISTALTGGGKITAVLKGLA